MPAPGPPDAVAVDVDEADFAAAVSRDGTAPQASVQDFLHLTTVQQTLLLLLGSLCFDVGSLACVPGRLVLAFDNALCARWRGERPSRE